MAHDVFISYASEDRVIADKVCKGLEKQGLRCWIAPRDILPAEQYDDAIIRAISEARAMVVIFSSNVFQSNYVKSEVERGFAKNLVIVPFRIESIEPKEGFELYFGRTQWLDATLPPMESHILKLSSTIHAFLQTGKQVEPQPPTQPPPKAPRRWLLLAGGVVLGVFLCVASVILVVSLNHPSSLAPDPTQTSMPTPLATVTSIPTPTPMETLVPTQAVQKTPDLSSISANQIAQSLPQVPDISPDVRQALIDAIVGADKAEIFAYFFRDDSYLMPYYDGAVLQQMQSEITTLISQKVIALSTIDLNQSYYPNVHMVGSSVIAVDACEYWKVDFYDQVSYALVTETPWRLVPQTINFELMGNSIKITSISDYQNNAFCTR